MEICRSLSKAHLFLGTVAMELLSSPTVSRMDFMLVQHAVSDHGSDFYVGMGVIEMF